MPFKINYFKMKPNPKFRKIQFPLFLLSLYCSFGLSQSLTQFDSYSTLSNPHSLSSVSSIPGNTVRSNSKEANKNVDLTFNTVGDQSQRSVGTSAYSPQGQGSHSMYYYEMYPSAKQAGQNCIYTADGMKCPLNRDSTADSSFGSGHQDSYVQAAPSNSYGAPMQAYEYGGTEHSEGAGGSASNAGLAGLIGLLGLKGFKALAPLGVLISIVPLLLPLLLPLLFILAIPLLLFLPVPVIVTPAPAPVMAKDIGGSPINTVAIYSVARMARDVLHSEECVERISCEVARASKKYQAEGWMDKLAGYLPESNSFAKKIKIGMKNEEKKSGESNTADEPGSGRGINNSESDGKCSRFVCKPTKIISKHLVQ